MFSVQLTHILIYFLLYRCITGEPTASVNSSAKTKVGKEPSRTGGGAIIPCTWLLWVLRGVEERVMEVIRARLPDVDGHEYMDVQVSKAGEKYNIMGANTFLFSFNGSTWKCLWLFGKQKSLIILL